MAYNSTSWITEKEIETVVGKIMYADFFINAEAASSFAAGYHEVLTFDNAGDNVGGRTPNLGNGPDPATSFTTADAIEQRASELVVCLWHLPDEIYIDGVFSLEGADAADGDVTRMHLMSFDFNSGVSACLTNGTLLAHSSDAGLTNAGSEQPYLSTWTVDSPSVLSGKVVVATFESDTINSDYSINVKVKYHLT